MQLEECSGGWIITQASEAVNESECAKANVPCAMTTRRLNYCLGLNMMHKRLVVRFIISIVRRYFSGVASLISNCNEHLLKRRRQTQKTIYILRHWVLQFFTNKISSLRAALLNPPTWVDTICSRCLSCFGKDQGYYWKR